MTDDHLPSYENLLTNTEMTSMQIRQMHIWVHILCIGIYKTLPNLHPQYRCKNFLRETHQPIPQDQMTLIPIVNPTSYGSRSIKSEGSHSRTIFKRTQNLQKI